VLVGGTVDVGDLVRPVAAGVWYCLVSCVGAGVEGRWWLWGVGPAREGWVARCWALRNQAPGRLFVVCFRFGFAGFSVVVWLLDSGREHLL
jgi:hypothetical protein